MNVILVGGGKTVYFLTRQFTAKGYNVAVVNDSEDDSRYLARQFPRVLVLHGDGSDAGILEDAGARQADALLALTPHDQDNLIACQVAQQLYGVPRTIAMVNDPDNEKLFSTLGVTTVFSATLLLAHLIEEQTGFDSIINLFPVAGGRITVTEVVLHDDAPSLNKTLRELEMPAESLIAGIIRNGETIVPSGHSRLLAGDRLVLISQPDNHASSLRTLVGKEV